MNLREVLQKDPRIAYGAAGAFFLLAAFSVLSQGRRTHGRPPGISSAAYYTTEDQLTGQAAVDALFVDDVDKVPPFDHDGKPAYLAIVFVCNGGRTKWVNHLKRYTPEVKKQAEAFIADREAKGARPPIGIADFDAAGAEFKVPGSGPWISTKDPAWSSVTACRVPADVPSDDVQFCVP